MSTDLKVADDWWKRQVPFRGDGTAQRTVALDQLLLRQVLE